jgi:hypothetical protein
MASLTCVEVSLPYSRTTVSPPSDGHCGMPVLLSKVQDPLGQEVPSTGRIITLEQEATWCLGRVSEGSSPTSSPVVDSVTSATSSRHLSEAVVNAMAAAYKEDGNSYLQMGELDRAYDSYRKGLKILQRHEESSLLAKGTETKQLPNAIQYSASLSAERKKTVLALLLNSVRVLLRVDADSAAGKGVPPSGDQQLPEVFHSRRVRLSKASSLLNRLLKTASYDIQLCEGNGASTLTSFQGTPIHVVAPPVAEAVGEVMVLVGKGYYWEAVLLCADEEYRAAAGSCSKGMLLIEKTIEWLRKVNAERLAGTTTTTASSSAGKTADRLPSILAQLEGNVLKELKAKADQVQGVLASKRL